MRKPVLAVVLALLACPAIAQVQFPTPAGPLAAGSVGLCQSSADASKFVPCGSAAAPGSAAPIDQTTPGTTNNVTTDGVVDGAVRTDTASTVQVGATFSTAGYSAIIFQVITPVASSVINIEGSNDGGSTWIATPVRNIASLGTAAGAATISGAAASGFMPTVVMPQMRWRASVNAGPALTVAVGFKRTVSPLAYDVNVGAGTITTVTQVGALNNIPLTTTTNGGLKHKLIALGTVNSTLVKTGISKIVGGYIKNLAVAVRYVKFYDKATAPTVGTDTPFFTLALNAGESINIAEIVGVYGLTFTLGNCYATTTGSADNDTGAVTAGDLIINLSYI